MYVKEIFSLKIQTMEYFTFSRRLLQLNPNLQDTFPSFRGVALEELMNSRSLFLHSQRLMAVVENAISSLNDAQEFIEHLMRLGERHLAMSVTEKHLKVGKLFVTMATEIFREISSYCMLYKVVLTFNSVDETLVCDHSNESYWAVLPCGTAYYAVQSDSNF